MSLASDTTPARVTLYQGFDPIFHLAPCYERPVVIKTDELGYSRTTDSDIAATKPFPLFTPEAVRRIRGEMFDHDTLANHLYSDSATPCVVRGACPQRARFTYEAWTHPTVVQRLNDFAGIPITPVFDYDIGHVNLQLGPRGWAGLKAEPDIPDSAGILGSQEEIAPTLMLAPNWHKDSYPFVCILMLSESSHIQGGRTVLRKGDGSDLYCDMPPIGHAMILQGGHVEHAVSPTDTTQERIAMVTSFRPVDPHARDVSVLTTVRASSDVPELHKQWCQSRLGLLGQRAKNLLERLETGNLDDSIEEEMRKFAEEQTEFLARTVGQMVDPIPRYRTSTARESFLKWKAGQGIAHARL